MSSKKTRRKNLQQFVALIVAVVVVVVASVFFQKWWNNRPGAEPRDIKITASSGGNSLDVSPFSACEPGTDCAENTVPELPVSADDKLKLTLPKDLYNQEWSLLKIYDDPAANDQSFFKSHEQKEVEVPGSVDSPNKNDTNRPRLVVVEVSAAMVGHNDAGEETPYTVVWSVKTS